MKKILLSAALMAACCVMNAQKLTYIPWADNALMMSTAVSNNGKYLAGCDTEGRAFIYNTESGQIKYFASPLLGDESQTTDPGADIRSVSNDGVGTGYLEDKATKFDFATGQYTKADDEDNSLETYISSDGKFKLGFSYDNTYVCKPYYIKDDNKHYLPLPTDEWTGYETNGFKTANANADGSIILGSITDNFATEPMLLWVRNRDNESYSVINVSKRFYDSSSELDGPQATDYFNGASISSNGKYVAVTTHLDKGSFEAGNTIARYDVANDNVEYITCADKDNGMSYYCGGIADDGTIVGFIEDNNTGARYGFICKAGETEAKRISEVYPTLTDLATMDANELNVPCNITPDGRYIVGYGYVSMDEENLCYGSYWIDTQGGETGIGSVNGTDSSAKVVASYSADGKKVNRTPNYRSLVINKMNNGKIKKVIK